ncbi:hypothetical protein CRG98_016112 [Punica granatum]|uniref:Uncharacterized protein n=1 Tax=Punica granatum TaxID=22663 RepID=A0A2I0K4G9_PUNGR|nr:hypothetical protein CRG98_016112 [Punica granatum]
MTLLVLIVWPSLTLSLNSFTRESGRRHKTRRKRNPKLQIVSDSSSSRLRLSTPALFPAELLFCLLSVTLDSDSRLRLLSVALVSNSPSSSFSQTIANVDLKLDFVPPSLINFILRRLIGSGFRLYQKVFYEKSNSALEID